MSWNKNRLAYTPLGPYVAKRYEEGLSYGLIAKEVGIPKGSVQNLCRAMGVTPRPNTGTHRPLLWEDRLSDYLERTGTWVVKRPKTLKKGSRVVIGCPHGERETTCQILHHTENCCRSSAHTGSKNSSYGKPVWNSGTKGVSKGGYGYGVNPSRHHDPDVLYLVTVADTTGKVHYKIGRSFHGPRRRLQRSLVTVIKEWEGPHWLVWTTEQSLLTQNSGSRSRPTPNLANGGGTECFGEQLPITSVISYCNFIFGMVDGQKTAYQG